jgi:predicted dehydrogenase
LGGGHGEGGSLVAVCDSVRPRADAVASKFGVPASYDIDDFLARKDIDAVAVLTPSGMHPAHVIACARTGKHVVVEKPMALRLQDADDMIRAWFFGDVVSVHPRAVTALAKIETEDTAVATLKFRNGALGIIEATIAARPTDLEGSLSILGEKGTVEIAGFAVNQIRHCFVDELASDKDVVEKFSVNPMRSWRTRANINSG